MVAPEQYRTYSLQEHIECKINFRTKYSLSLPQEDRAYTFFIKGKDDAGAPVSVAFVWATNLELTESNGIRGPALKGGPDPNDPRRTIYNSTLATICSGTASFLFRSNASKPRVTAEMLIEDLRFQDTEMPPFDDMSELHDAEAWTGSTRMSTSTDSASPGS